MAPTRGFEPPTYRLGGGRSILLSYVGKYQAFVFYRTCRVLSTISVDKSRRDDDSSRRLCLFGEMALSVIAENLAAERGGFLLTVRGKQDRTLRRRLRDQCEHTAAQSLVETLEGLVEHKKIRSVCQCARK